jgi:hypothetical protein
MCSNTPQTHNVSFTLPTAYILGGASISITLTGDAMFKGILLRASAGSFSAVSGLYQSAPCVAPNVGITHSSADNKFGNTFGTVQWTPPPAGGAMSVTFVGMVLLSRNGH